MNWQTVKKYLYAHNRVTELCNKGTGNEIITTWNGLMLMEWSSEHWINLLWRSGRKIKVVNLDGDFVRWEHAPQKNTNQLKLF